MTSTPAAASPAPYRRGTWAPGRRREPLPENPYERFHLAWSDDFAGFRASHIGLDIPEERCIDRTNPIETVEWLLPGWRVLTRLRTEKVLTWRDTGDTAWAYTGRTEPPAQKGCREHLLLARDPDVANTQDTAPSAMKWALFSLPTTNARPFFLSYGRSPITSHHFRNWTAWERMFATQFSLRTAVVGATPLVLVDSLCMMHEDPPSPGDSKWWNVPDLTRTLAAALAGQTGSGTHHSGASRKAALALHADTLTATRTMLALGAFPAWNAIQAD